MIRGVCFLWITACFGFAAPVFVPPDESYPLVDRGRLPLNVPAIEKLADAYATLADQTPSGNPPELRRQAQLIALAQRLSPAQEMAREVRLGLISGNYQQVSTPEERKIARDRVMLAMKWLLNEPAASEGYLLGQLTLDIIAGIQPNHPLLVKHDAAGTLRRWHGAVAPLVAFGEEKKTPVPAPEPTPEPVPSPPTGPTFQLTDLITGVPMIVESHGGLKNASLVRLNLNLRLREKQKSDLQFTPSLIGKNAPPFLADLTSFFESRGQPLPSGALFDVNTGTLSYSSLNQDNLFTPLAAMLDSALSGKELAKDVILLGKLSLDGTLSRPARSWELIQALRERRPAFGTRLLVPPSLAEEMAGLLVLKDPAFLFRYEVMACRTLEEAAQFYLVANHPPESLSSASAIFREVSLKGSQRMRDLPTFLVYDSVRKRLAAAAQADPRHLSASVLLRQASARRPTEYTRRVFAMEYLLALSELANAPSLSGNRTPYSTLKSYHLARRREWRAFADRRMIGRDEEDLVAEGQKVIDALSPIYRKFSKPKSSSSSGFGAAYTLRIEYEQWRAKVTLFLAKLDKIASE